MCEAWSRKEQAVTPVAVGHQLVIFWTLEQWTVDLLLLTSISK